MSHQVEVEGSEGAISTGYATHSSKTHTSNDNIHNNEMKNFLLNHNVSDDTIDKLITAGLNTMDHLKEIELEHLNEIATECGIKSSLEKVKLKTAIKALKPKLPNVDQNTVSPGALPVMIDKEERLALAQMDTKIQSIQAVMDLVNATTNNIDEQVNAHKSMIKSVFQQLHVSLDKREASITQRLNQIAAERKKKLQNALNALNQQHAHVKQQHHECSVKVSKPIQSHQMESRVRDVSQVAQQVTDIKVITNHDSVLANNTINVLFDKTALLQTLDSFGDVFGAPQLFALCNNEDGTVSVEWELIGSKPLQNNNTKLRVEWTPTSTEDTDQLDEKWQYEQQMDLNHWKGYETAVVNVVNTIASYAFRIQYFDGFEWSPPSNIKSVTIDHLIFKYESDFDMNGIVYYLGSDGGKSDWQNPSKKGIIKIDSVPLRMDSKAKHNFVGREPVRCLTKNTRNAWFSIDFGDAQIKPTHYTLRHYVSWKDYCLRSWELQGSRDGGKQWSTIRQHINDKSLAHKSASHTWPLDECNEFYSLFRIRITGKNSGRDWSICCSGFEIYGQLMFADKTASHLVPPISKEWTKSKSI
eukprot:115638_1